MYSILSTLLCLCLAFLIDIFRRAYFMSKKNFSPVHTYISCELNAITDLTPDDGQTIDFFHTQLINAGFYHDDLYKVISQFPETEYYLNYTWEKSLYASVYIHSELNILGCIFFSLMKNTYFSSTPPVETISKEIDLFVESTFKDNFTICGTTKYITSGIPPFPGQTFHCTKENEVAQMISDVQSCVAKKLSTHLQNQNLSSINMPDFLNQQHQSSYDYWVAKKYLVYDACIDLYHMSFFHSILDLFIMFKFKYFTLPKLKKQGASFLPLVTPPPHNLYVLFIASLIIITLSITYFFIRFSNINLLLICLISVLSISKLFQRIY